MPGLRIDRVWPALALAAAMLGGCSGNAPISEFAFGKVYTPPPVDPNAFPANYKADIAEILRTTLTDPRKIKDGFIGQPVLKSVAGNPRYVTCARFNPRDASGQYEGTISKLAIFLGGRVNQFLPGDPEMCAGLNYQRYPEIESMVP